MSRIVAPSHGELQTQTEHVPGRVAVHGESGGDHDTITYDAKSGFVHIFSVTSMYGEQSTGKFLNRKIKEMFPDKTVDIHWRSPSKKTACSMLVDDLIEVLSSDEFVRLRSDALVERVIGALNIVRTKIAGRDNNKRKRLDGADGVVRGEFVTTVDDALVDADTDVTGIPSSEKNTIVTLDYRRTHPILFHEVKQSYFDLSHIVPAGVEESEVRIRMCENHKIVDIVDAFQLVLQNREAARSSWIRLAACADETPKHWYLDKVQYVCWGEVEVNHHPQHRSPLSVNS